MHVLPNVLPLLLEDVPWATRLDIYYQHNRAPAFNTRIVQELLRVTFRKKFNATHRPIEWSLRCPYLIPLNFFL